MVSVRLVAMGNIVSELDSAVITGWKSDLFTIEKEIKRGILPQKADCLTGIWDYSDNLLEQTFSQIKFTSPSDITFYILDAPIQENWLSRILSKNRVVITYYQVKELLQKENIPLENYIIVCIYVYVLLYLAKGNKGLTLEDETAISHDYRENCLYDMCGIKQDVIYKCVQPIICEQCKAKLIYHSVTVTDVNKAEKELKRLKRTSYYRIVQMFKVHPYASFFLSCILAIGLNVIASIIINCFCK